VRGAGNALVNLNIPLQHGHVLREDDLLEFAQLNNGAPLRSQISHLRHYETACLQHTKEGSIVVIQAYGGFYKIKIAALQKVPGIDPVAVTDFEQFQIFEFAQGLTQSCAINIERLSHFSFRWQFGSRNYCTIHYLLLDYGHYFLMESQTSDWLGKRIIYRHKKSPHTSKHHGKWLNWFGDPTNK